MIIETKFDVGDEVYILNKTFEYTNEPCSVCNGKKLIELVNGLTLECPNCHGNGYIKTSKPIYQVWENKLMIEHLNFSSWGHGNEQVCYRLFVIDKSKYEHELFKTKQEAQKECDRLNKEESK